MMKKVVVAMAMCAALVACDEVPEDDGIDTVVADQTPDGEFGDVPPAGITDNTTVTQDGMTVTASGLQYKITEAGTGEKVQFGDLLEVHYRGSLKSNGSVFDESFTGEVPLLVKAGVGMVIPGWDEGLALLTVGDKATFFIPSNLAYGAGGAGDMIPPNADLMFDVEVVGKITTPFNLEGKTPVVTDGGMKVYSHERPSSIKIEQGDIVGMHYEGRFEDGTVFDSSFEKGQPYQFEASPAGQAIQGWLESTKYLYKGEKATLVIPASLAYGEAGAGGGAIPPNATLIFDVIVAYTVDPVARKPR